MQKVLFLLFFLYTILLAETIPWAESYPQAVKMAKKENKGIMLVVTAQSCSWCKKLKQRTLQDQSVAKRVTSEYIALELVKECDLLPLGINTNVVPTTIFISNDGKKVIKKVPGYWKSEDFISWLDDVKKLHKNNQK